MGVEEAYMADFLAGFDKAEMDEADKREKARQAGIEIRQQVMNQIIPQINRQINDSTDLLDKARFVEGFRAAIAGNAQLTADSAQAVTAKQMDYYNSVKMEAKYGQNRRDGEAFLAANAKKDSVVTTKSGLQYKILTAGTGAVPTATQKVKVNYEGRLIDGTVFDSSYKRKQPATFACNQVIKGWTEALTMMPVGSKWEVYIPQELGYGSREAGKIPPFSTLIFTVELLEIVQ
jgi:FKBP-type peptidyl-prolyl cis-trans isomerase FklB